MKKQQNATKNTARYQLPSLSPMHERADYSRKIIKINDAIKSILSISHMQRMDLIAINNRSLCNHSKIKRAERTNRKTYNKSQLPNLKDLRLDSRKHSIAKNHQLPKNSATGIGRYLKTTSGTDLQTDLCEKFIEEYLERLKQEKRFDILGDRSRLIEQACKQILSKIELGKKKPQKLDKSMNIEPELVQIRLPVNYRKNHSISQIEYSEQLNRIRRSSEYSSKARALNQKMFLRKIKHIKIHSQPQ